MFPPFSDRLAATLRAQPPIKVRVRIRVRVRAAENGLGSGIEVRGLIVIGKAVETVAAWLGPLGLSVIVIGVIVIGVIVIGVIGLWLSGLWLGSWLFRRIIGYLYNAYR